MRRVSGSFALGLGLWFLGAPSAAVGDDARSPAAATYDVLIRGGLVVDGTGKPPVRGDVAVRDGRITVIGDLSGATADDVIDASDKVVAPGFIDLHSHADRGILEFRSAENYIRQGVTTLLCGRRSSTGPPFANRTSTRSASSTSWSTAGSC